MVIDFHTHCFPDELAWKAVPVLAECAGLSARVNGTISDIKRSMKDAGIDISVIQSISTKPAQVEKITDWSAEIQDQEILAFASINPDYAGWYDELGRIRNLGIKGIKFHPDYQKFFVDDKGMFPIYERAIDQGLVVIFHAGVDIGLPAPYHCTPERMATVLKTFREGTFIAAHMGGYTYWDDVERYLVGTDVYLDTSFTLGWIENEQFIRIINNHGHDKILFGTDSPWTDQAEEVNKLKSLKLEPGIEKAILGGNAARILEL